MNIFSTLRLLNIGESSFLQDIFFIGLKAISMILALIFYLFFEVSNTYQEHSQFGTKGEVYNCINLYQYQW
jgi:hypothetical protein